MKKLILPILVLVFLILIGCKQQPKEVSNIELVKSFEQLYEVQNYFKLKDMYDKNSSGLSKKYTLYFGGLISNAFNQAEQSNDAIDQLLTNYKSELNDTLLSKIYQVKLLNHINLYEYKEAEKVSYLLLEDFKLFLDSTEVEDIDNEINIWKGLSEVPKQEINKSKD